MKICTTCARSMRSDSKCSVCRICAQICACGAIKDHRALLCRSCCSKIQARSQWADGNKRARIQAAIKASGPARWVRFEHITIESFRQRSDGRFIAHYRTDEGDLKQVYRYQWVWIRAHGLVPKGKMIHHDDHVPWHDDLENLRCWTRAEHQAHHAPEIRAGRQAQMERVGR